MKIVCQSLCMIGISVFLCGCPYESEVPLDQPKEKVNLLHLGRWKSNSDYCLVSARDAYHYDIAVFDRKESEPEHYRGYLTTINGACFMNVWEHNANGRRGKYFFVRLDLNGSNQVVLSVVTESITEQFSTSGALNQFFASNGKNSYFFDRDRVTLIRTQK